MLRKFVAVWPGGHAGQPESSCPQKTPQNAAAVKAANADGFTINLSANKLAPADQLAALGVGPVVTALPTNELENTQTPEGRKVVVCPAVTRDNVSLRYLRIACPAAGRDRRVPCAWRHKARVDAIARHKAKTKQREYAMKGSVEINIGDHRL